MATWTMTTRATTALLWWWSIVHSMFLQHVFNRVVVEAVGVTSKLYIHVSYLVRWKLQCLSIFQLQDMIVIDGYFPATMKSAQCYGYNSAQNSFLNITFAFFIELALVEDSKILTT